jgi:mannose-6-phosphate isomerase-like protein (cupin superfamily)
MILLYQPPLFPPAVTPMSDRITLHEKFARISDHWNPRVVAELNGQQVKLVKILGEFDWHSHDAEDELFMVHRGEFRMDFRDHSVTMRAGDILVVPRGVEHRPVAAAECEIVLFEPASTLNTGDVVTERTRAVLERL